MPSLRADAPEFLNIGASTSGASGILGGDARKVPMWTPMEPMDRDAGPTLIPTQLRGDGMPASDVQRVWEDSVQTVTPWPGLQADKAVDCPRFVDSHRPPKHGVGFAARAAQRVLGCQYGVGGGYRRAPRSVGCGSAVVAA